MTPDPQRLRSGAQLIVCALAGAVAGTLLDVWLRSRFTPAAAPIDVDSAALEHVLSSCGGALLTLITYAYAYYNARAAGGSAHQAWRAGIVDNASDAIVGTNLEGIVITWNHAAETMFGYRADEAIGKRVMDLIVPSGLESEEETILRALARGAKVNIRETQRRRRNGSLLDVAVATTPILDAHGRILGMAKTITDSSVKKAVEARLHELNLSLQAQVIEHSDALRDAERQYTESRAQLSAVTADRDALFAVLMRHALVSITDAHGAITEVNEAFCQLTGYSRSELLGQDHRLLNSGRIEPEFWHSLSQTLRAGQSFRGEVCNRAKDGTLFTIDSIIAPFFTSAGKIERFVTIGFDISAAKRTLAALEQSQQRLDLVLHEMRAGMWEWNAQTGELRASARWAELVGRSQDELRGLGLFDLHQEEDREPAQQALGRLLRGESAHFESESRLQHREGHHIWVLSRAVIATRTLDGEPEWIHGLDIDVTSTLETQRALKEVYARFNLAAELAGIGVWELDVASERMIADEGMYKLFRRSVSPDGEQLAQWLSRVHPEDLPELETKARLVVASGSELRCEFRVVVPDEDVRHVQCVGRVERQPDGTAQRMTGLIIDITRLRQTEDALLRQHRFTSLVAENLPGMVVYWNANERCAFSNQAYRQWLNRGADDEIENVRMQELLGTERYMTECQLVHAALSGGPIRLERQLTLSNGAERAFWAHYLPNHSGDKVHGVLSIFVDVGELRQAQTHLQQLNEALQERTRQAEQASQAKSAFIANVSHELRTPLNAVLGMAYLIAQTSLTDEQASLLNKLSVAGRSLLGVINDVLDLSKVESGELQLEETTFNLRALLDELASVMQPEAEAKGLHLLLKLDHELPRVVCGDALRLRQVLTNLLNNAIKFTERGSVTLVVAVQESDARRALLSFSVQDTGPGMSADVQARVFQPFMQADTSTTRRFGGTGLGLAIVKRLVKLMDGDVELTSTPGLGSEFTVLLPLWVESALSSTMARPIEVLIAGDSKSQRETINKLTRALGWRGELLTDTEALRDRVLERATAGAPFEVLLLICKRAQDALESVQALARALLPEHMPTIVAILEEARPSLHPELTLLGVDVVLPQHVLTASVLFNGVQEAMAARHGPPVAPPSRQNVDVRVLRNKRVLVVDDSELNCEVVERLLRAESMQVQIAHNGRVAVERLREDPRAYDLVLMDLQMPELDGLDATRIIRKELGLQELAIIAITAGALTSERQRAQEVGMDGFVSKPFEPAALLSKLALHLSPERQTEISTTRSSIPLPSPPDDWPRLPGVDRAESFARFAGDRDFMGQILATLLREYADICGDQLARLHPTKQLVRLHKLAGSAGAAGAMDVCQVARQMEQRLRRGDVDALSTLQHTLDQHMDQLKRAAEQLSGLRRSQSPAYSGPAPQGDLLRQYVSELLPLLRAHKMEALSRYEALESALTAELGAEAGAALQAAMQGLDFKRARQLLEVWRDSTAPAASA